MASWGRCSEPGVPASTTTCRLARQEPSLSSRKEKPFESRRVRTQPLTVTASFGSVAARRCLISVRMGMFWTLRSRRKRSRNRPARKVTVEWHCIPRWLLLKSCCSMAVSFHSASYPWLQRVLRHRSWLLVGLVILCVVMVRVHLRDMPLERDEGEHAYAGQLMLHGELPYQYVHTAELPGTYAAFALIMGVLGQSASGIRLWPGAGERGFHPHRVPVWAGGCWTTLRLWLRSLAFALLSLSPSVQGLGAHTDTFRRPGSVGRDARAAERVRGEGRRKNAECRSQNADAPRPSPLALRSFLAGLLFGLALVMEQRGVFFGLFGMVYLLRVRVGEWLAVSGARKQQPGLRSLRERIVFDFRSEASRAGRARLIRTWGCLGWGGCCRWYDVRGAMAGGDVPPFVFQGISSAGQYAWGLFRLCGGRTCCVPACERSRALM